MNIWWHIIMAYGVEKRRRKGNDIGAGGFFQKRFYLDNLKCVGADIGI